METKKINLTTTQWYQVTANAKENYLLQSTGSTFFVLVKASDTEPEADDEDEVHTLNFRDAINHMILSGVIWAKALQGPSSISLSKNWEEEDA